MDIAAYLKENSLTQEEFASMVGVTQGRVSHWLGGEKIPAERCVQIEIATDGKVSREDLRPDVFATQRPDQQKAA